MSPDVVSPVRYHRPGLDPVELHVRAHAVDFESLLPALAALSPRAQEPLVERTRAAIERTLAELGARFADEPGELQRARAPWACALYDEEACELWPGFPSSEPPPLLRLVQTLRVSQPDPLSLAALIRACPRLEALEFYEPFARAELDVLADAVLPGLEVFMVDQDQRIMDEDELPLPSDSLAVILTAFPGLRELYIAGGLDDQSLHELAREATAPLGVTTLILRDHRFTAAGIEALTRVPFVGLRSLCLVSCLGEGLGLDALGLLARAPALASLEELTGFYGAGRGAWEVVRGSPYLSDDLLTDF